MSLEEDTYDRLLFADANYHNMFPNNNAENNMNGQNFNNNNEVVPQSLGSLSGHDGFFSLHSGATDADNERYHQVVNSATGGTSSKLEPSTIEVASSAVGAGYDYNFEMLNGFYPSEPGDKSSEDEDVDPRHIASEMFLPQGSLSYPAHTQIQNFGVNNNAFHNHSFSSAHATNQHISSKMENHSGNIEDVHQKAMYADNTHAAPISHENKDMGLGSQLHHATDISNRNMNMQSSFDMGVIGDSMNYDYTNYDANFSRQSSLQDYHQNYSNASSNNSTAYSSHTRMGSRGAVDISGKIPEISGEVSDRDKYGLVTAGLVQDAQALEILQHSLLLALILLSIPGLGFLMTLSDLKKPPSLRSLSLPEIPHLYEGRKIYSSNSRGGRLGAGAVGEQAVINSAQQIGYNDSKVVQDIIYRRLLMAEQLKIEFPEQSLQTKKPIACSHCDYTAPNILELAKHFDKFRINAGHKCPFETCPFNFIGFTRKAELRRHCISSHFERGKLNESTNQSVKTVLSNLVYSCKFPNCGKNFYRKDSLQRHLKLVHENENSKFNKKLKKMSKNQKNNFAQY